MPKLDRVNLVITVSNPEDHTNEVKAEFEGCAAEKLLAGTPSASGTISMMTEMLLSDFQGTRKWSI